VLSFPFPPFARLAFAAAFSIVLCSVSATPTSLVIVIDGLRPDYITPQVMPNLHAFGAAGDVAEDHHAVFPTVTRVNSSSIATGTYPRAHGLMHNTIFLPEVSPNAIDTGEAPALLEAARALGGRLLTAPTLGDLLAGAGKKILVVGSGSTGSALLLNPTLPDGASLIASRKLVRPASLQARVDAVLGPAPAADYPSRGANRWIIDAYLEIGLKELKPDVTLMWVTDPDGTAHRNGPGAPKTVEALRHVDEELGRLFSTLRERGLRDQVNIFITADHGFSTHGGPFNLTALLTARGLADGVKVVGGNQLYVRAGGDEKIRRIVAVLQETTWVGAIFTRAKTAGSHEGIAPGTLSLDSIHHQHPRAADILVDPNWSRVQNEYGFAGTTTSGGVAGHGSSGPYDIQIRLLASGPDLKQATRSNVPTGNIDLAATLCQLHGIAPAPSMAGRVLGELLRSGPSPATIKVEKTVHHVAAKTSTGRYEITLHKSRVGRTEYVDYTETSR
jgi:hypothetical protein